MKSKAREKDPAAVWVNVKDLVPWVKNPRKNDQTVDKAVASIRRFGWGAPILAREQNGEIIAGHTRIKAALKLGIERVPVRYMRLSEKEAHALAVADNKIAEFSTWDETLLEETLEMYREDLEIVDATGFEYREIFSTEEQSSESKEDEIPEPPKRATTKRGDLWLLGEHRLICGDCREQSSVSVVVDGGQVDVAFTSPPYATRRKYDASSGFRPIRPEDFVGWFSRIQANVARLLAPHGSWFVNIKEHTEDGQRSLYVKDLTIAHVRDWG